jgi:hypothetical protein
LIAVRITRLQSRLTALFGQQEITTITSLALAI